MQQKQLQGSPQTEIIPQSKKFRNEKMLKEYKINIQLVCETSLDEALTRGLSEEERIEAVIELRSIHLEWLNIRKIENLEVFTNLNVLYLQHNKIAKIEHLQCLKNLEYLALNDNLISKVQGLSQLKKLSGLNLNNNQIQQVNADSLPPSIQLISFKQNPVCLDTNYKIDLVKHLPVLQVLDDYTITPEERLKIVGKFPQHLLQYSEKMKHFRNKQKVKKQLQQQAKNNKPLYLGGNVDQTQALKQIRQKTQKFMTQAHQAFETDVKQQQQNFESKIKVSRKIREFKKQNNQKMMKMSQIKETNEEHNQQN